MKKRQAARYNARIGQLMVEFLEYYQTHEQLLEEGENSWDLDEGLEYFGSEQGLTLSETYQIAMMLNEQRYPIDPSTFHPDYVEGESAAPGELEGLEQQFKRTVHDDYEDALNRTGLKTHIEFMSQ